MHKFSFLTSTLAFTTSLLISMTSIEQSHADTPASLQAIAQVKQLAPGQIPAGVKLADKQIFRGHLKDNPTSFDPQLIDDIISATTVAPVFDPLIRQAENGQYIPSAAESYQVSADGKTWIFKLRPQAKWQDGKPVLARDFVYAFQRITDPNTASPNGNYLALAHVVNAQAINDGKLPVSKLGVTALDDYTLQIQLESPTPWLLQMLAMYGVAPVRKDLIAKYGKSWSNIDHLVGNGPYKLTKYSPNDELDYQKWDGYWNAKNIHIQNIQYLVIKNDNSAYLKYISGDLDLTETSATTAVLARKNLPQEVVTAPLKGVGFFSFDIKRVPKVVRHAIALVVDNKFLVDKILKTNVPTSIFVPQSVQEAEGTSQTSYFNQDIAQRRSQAIQELEAAGYTPQHPYTITLLHQNTNLDNLASNAFRAWITKGTGGRIVYKDLAQETKTFYQSEADGTYPFSYSAWYVSYDQASNLYNSFMCHDPWNTFHYCNPEYDQLIVDASKSLDRKQRLSLYQQANLLLQRDLPVVPIFWFTATFLRKTTLGGYNPEVYPLAIRDLYITKP